VKGVDVAAGGRLDRVQRLAKQVLGEAIHDLKDPRIGFATVTAVRVTPDLQHARVLVSVLGSPEEQEQTMKGLKSAKAHLRSELGRQVRMKYSPDLTFQLDHGPEEAERLESLLRRIHEDERQEDDS
jgi:ribosome-binding factor A